MKTKKLIALSLAMILILVTLCGCMKLDAAITFKADGKTADVLMSLFYSESYFEYVETTPEEFFTEQEIPMDQVITKTIDGELYYGFEEHASGPIEESLESSPVEGMMADETLEDATDIKTEFYEENGKQMLKITMTIEANEESDEETLAMISSMISMKLSYTFENGLKSATAVIPDTITISGNSVTVDAYPRQTENIVTIIGVVGDAEKASGTKEPADAPKSVFSDVPADAYYAEAVAWAYENKVTSGMGNGTFGSDVTCNRAQVVTFLWNAAGQPEPKTTENPFTDVKSTDWFFKAVLWAVENGITSGTSATTFNPTGTCQNSHILTFLWNSLGQPGKTEAYAGKQWYDDAFNWAKTEGLLKDIPGADIVTNPCPRKNIVTFMYRNTVE